MDIIYTIEIPLAPVTKKNSQQIVHRYNKSARKWTPMIIPSKQYKEYEQYCGWFLNPFSNLSIDYPVNVKAIYYMPTRRRVDLVNLHEALHDILVKYGVLADDNYKIIAGTDGSRVRYDKANPRTEVVITKMEE